MKAGPLIVLLVLGGVALYVLLKMRGPQPARSSSSSGVSPNVSPAPGAPGTGPTGGYDRLQGEVDALSLLISRPGTLVGTAAGTTVGSVAGAGVGSAVSSGEQSLGRTLGATPLTDAQIAALESNSASNGLTAGATSGANVSGVVGGFAGALANVFPSFAKAAAPPFAAATPVNPRGGPKSVWDVPFLGGIWHASDAVFGGTP